MTATRPATVLASREARGWHESLSAGAAGLALAHVEYARSGTGSWKTAQRWAAAMLREPITAVPDACCLFRGAPAVAFVLLSAGNPAYAATLDTLYHHITTITRRRLEHAHARIDCGLLPALREYDLIRGLTGIGAYLLAREPEGDLLRDVLAYLVRLTEPVTIGDETLPGWWTDRAPDDRPSARWPGGHGNLGIAHGIAGPLALMSLALRRGVEVPGQADAIDQVRHWLDRWRCGPPPTQWWPGTITRLEHNAGVADQPGPQRPSWCYGTPGLARAQQVAAIALGDEPAQRRAEQVLADCIADPAQLALLTDGSLCHGWAGVLQATWRAAGDAGPDSRLAALLPGLRDRTERHLLVHWTPYLDGLLEGQTGTRLALHTTATPPLMERRWDSCLLLQS